MKLNQNIYIAIQRGLNEALSNLSIDDFGEIESEDQTSVEDIETFSGVEQNYIYRNYVDLGLPSGTLWCKYDIGSIYEEYLNDDEYVKELNGNLPTRYLWHGRHFVWGAINTYGKQRNVYKNVFHQDLPTPPAELPIENDAAYAKFHDKCKNVHMPTVEQMQELIDNTTPILTKAYMGVSMLKGMILRSNINGKELFFPFGGVSNSEKESYIDVGFIGKVWTRSLLKDSFGQAYYMYFSEKNCYGRISTDFIDAGMSIRPVISKK